MKKIMFLQYFLFAIAYAHGNSMSVDGQETHAAKNPGIYNMQQASEYSGLVCDAIPVAGVVIYHDHCDAACYASNVKVSAKVGLTRFAQQMNLINSTEGGRLLSGTFDANDIASVGIMKAIINKYGKVYDIDLQGVVYSLLGVVNDFSGKSEWIFRSDITAVSKFITLDFRSIPGCSANSIYVIAKADCGNNANDDLTLALYRGKATIVGGTIEQNPNPQGNGNSPASNDPNFQKLVDLAKAQSTPGQPIIIVYSGGNTATATPASGNVGTCGCPNPNITVTPAPVVVQQTAPFQQTVTQVDPNYDYGYGGNGYNNQLYGSNGYGQSGYGAYNPYGVFQIGLNFGSGGGGYRSRSQCPNYYRSGQGGWGGGNNGWNHGGGTNMAQGPHMGGGIPGHTLSGSNGGPGMGHGIH